MVAPPTTLCVTGDISARPGISPEVIAREVVWLVDGGSLQLTELRWDLEQFDFADPEFAKKCLPGCMHTFVVALSDVEMHLQQHRSAFWTSCPLDARSSDEPARIPGGHAPKWRKRSNRFWPSIDGVTVPFIGQTHMAGGDIYLFQTAAGEILAHRVDRFAQDVEDHYDDEARREGW